MLWAAGGILTQGASSRAVFDAVSVWVFLLDGMHSVKNEGACKDRGGSDGSQHYGEPILYLCCEEAEPLMERNGEEDAPKEWVFDLFGDMDRIRFLYSHVNLEDGRFYHFSHWADRQFYRKRPL